MRVVIDIETDKLENPTKVWVVVCKDIDTGELYIWRNGDDKRYLRDYLARCDVIIAHNLMGFDRVWINILLDIDVPLIKCFDTLIASKLNDYSRDGHSIEDYGLEYGLPKGNFKDFSKYSKEMEEYCVRDVEICSRIYSALLHVYGRNSANLRALQSEQAFQEVVNSLHTNGFGFNRVRAESLLVKVTKELEVLDEAIHANFPPRRVVVKVFTPKATKYGTISKTSVPRSLWNNIHEYELGKSYEQTKEVPFNPASHKQIVDVLNEAGWKPVDRTQTYIVKQREAIRNRVDIPKEDRYSWKINEANLQTLPANAPSPARTLARRILLESRRRTLTEWLSLVTDDNRIHGKFFGIGAWTQRMAHQAPNTANIPNSHDTQGKLRLYGAEMRALWCAPKNRLLVGVDAEGIQLRIFAHLINDPEFTEALVKGRKDDKSDPHSLNQRIIGRICKSRQAAKRWIYALLLGAGIGKLSEILECSREQAQEALDRVLDRYKGWQSLKEKDIPRDSQRGYFIGLDGRKVKIFGTSPSERRHLAMSGYLQNGEVVIMKTATLLWLPRVLEVDPTALLVNMVHDEWQTEVQNDFMLAKRVAEIQADSLREVGEMFGLKCPLAGSYYNDDIKDYTIGTNWKVTH